MTRAKRLLYQGTEGDRKGDYFNFAPMRDLDEVEISRFTDEEYAELTSPHPSPGMGPLYIPDEPRVVKPVPAKGEDK